MLLLSLIGHRKTERVFCALLEPESVASYNSISIPISLHAKLIPAAGSLESGSRP